MFIERAHSAILEDVDGKPVDRHGHRHWCSPQSAHTNPGVGCRSFRSRLQKLTHTPVHRCPPMRKYVRAAELLAAHSPRFFSKKKSPFFNSGAEAVEKCSEDCKDVRPAGLRSQFFDHAYHGRNQPYDGDELQGRIPMPLAFGPLPGKHSPRTHELPVSATLRGMDRRAGGSKDHYLSRKKRVWCLPNFAAVFHRAHSGRSRIHSGRPPGFLKKQSTAGARRMEIVMVADEVQKRYGQDRKNGFASQWERRFSTPTLVDRCQGKLQAGMPPFPAL